MSDGTHVRLKKIRDGVLRDGLEIYLFDVQQGAIFPSKPLDFSEKAEGIEIETVGTISKEAAQELLDDLWDAGYRPRNAVNNSGVIAAKDAHIAHLAKFLEMALSK